MWKRHPKLMTRSKGKGLRHLDIVPSCGLPSVKEGFQHNSTESEPLRGWQEGRKSKVKLQRETGDFPGGRCKQ